MRLNYNRTGEKIDIIVRDYTGMKIESWSCKIDDKVSCSKLMKYLKDKYGFSPEIDTESSVNNKKKDFLDPDSNFLNI